MTDHPDRAEQTAGVLDMIANTPPGAWAHPGDQDTTGHPATHVHSHEDSIPPAGPHPYDDSTPLPAGTEGVVNNTGEPIRILIPRIRFRIPIGQLTQAMTDIALGLQKATHALRPAFAGTTSHRPEPPEPEDITKAIADHQAAQARRTRTRTAYHRRHH